MSQGFKKSNVKGTARSEGGRPETAREKVASKKVLPQEAVSKMLYLVHELERIYQEQDELYLACGYEFREAIEDKNGVPILLEVYGNCTMSDGWADSDYDMARYFQLNRVTGSGSSARICSA